MDSPEGSEKNKKHRRFIAIFLAGMGGFFIVRAATLTVSEQKTQAQSIADTSTQNSIDQRFTSLIEAAATIVPSSDHAVESAVVIPPESSSWSLSSSSATRGSRNRKRIVPVAHAAERPRPEVSLDEIQVGTKTVNGTPLITVDVIAHNTGSTPSSAGPVTIFVQPSSGGRTVIGQLTIPSIASGDTQSLSSSFVAPSIGNGSSVCVSVGHVFAIAVDGCQSVNLPALQGEARPWEGRPAESPPSISTTSCTNH